MAEKISTINQEELNAWPQGKALCDCLVELYDKGLLTDVNFRCEDHEEGALVQAHKLVLAARSPVLRAMFFGPCSRKKSEIVLKTARSETLKLFLRYLYCDKITLTEEKALAVLEMAHCYQVTSLVQYCADYLTTVISARNVCGVLTYAMQYGLTNLKSCCCSFIDNHTKEVLNSDDFMSLSAELLLYILKGDTLDADEKLILEAAEKWSRMKINESGLEETGANIRKCLGDAFYYLRLPTMTSNSFRECTSRKGYFSVEEYADIAAFVSKAPGISVSTNSCVGRCPEKQTLTLNDGCGSLVAKDNIREVLQISVSKDVALSSISFSEMTLSFKLFGSPVYKYAYHSTEYEKNILSKYENKAIIVTPNSNSTQHDVWHLIRLEDIDLPQDLKVVLFGKVALTDLHFNHTFSMQQPGPDNGRIIFEPPVLLKKRSSPYFVELNAYFTSGNNSPVIMKTKESNEKEITSPTGHVQIKSTSGLFAGIRDIQFINFSNRDVCAQTATKGTDETPLSTK